MFFLFTGSLYSLVAQTTDSTRTMSTDSTTMMTNSNMKSDSSVAGSNMNKMSSRMDTMHNMNNRSNANMGTNGNGSTDSMHSMNNNSNSNMGKMNNVGTNSNSTMMNNNNSSMMNNNMGSGSMAALPVLENAVPDAVVAKAKEKFGSTLYDITSSTHVAGQNSYVVRTQTNGNYSTQWIDDSGNTMQ